MRFAFVVRLGNETRPAEGIFEGSVEEVDSCTEVRFRSTEELLKFLGQRFDLAAASADRIAEKKNRAGRTRKDEPQNERTPSTER